MKVLSYEAFSELRAAKLKHMRKSLGLTRDEVGSLFNNDYHITDGLEHVWVKSAYRSDYLNYIYQIILDETSRTGKSAKDILKEVVDGINS